MKRVKKVNLQKRRNLDAYARGAVEHHHRNFNVTMKVAKKRKKK